MQTPNKPSKPQSPAVEPDWLPELKQELMRLEGRLAKLSGPPDSVAEVLEVIGDWPEQWISLVENQKPNRYAFSPELTAFKDQTLYLAKWCEQQSMDSSALVGLARGLQQTYFALRPDLPNAGDDVWVFLDRLKLRFEPIDQAGGKNNKKTTIPRAEADVLVRDYLKKHPDATAKKTAEAVGIAQGRLPGLASWRELMKKRKYEKHTQTPKGKPARPLTDKMLAAIEKGDTPDAIAEAKEAKEIAWHAILDAATPEQRRQLHAMPEEAKRRSDFTLSSSVTTGKMPMMDRLRTNELSPGAFTSVMSTNQLPDARRSPFRRASSAPVNVHVRS